MSDVQMAVARPRLGKMFKRRGFKGARSYKKQRWSNQGYKLYKPIPEAMVREKLTYFYSCPANGTGLGYTKICPDGIWQMVPNTNAWTATFRTFDTITSNPSTKFDKYLALYDEYRVTTVVAKIIPHYVPSAVTAGASTSLMATCHLSKADDVSQTNPSVELMANEDKFTVSSTHLTPMLKRSINASYYSQTQASKPFLLTSDYANGGYCGGSASSPSAVLCILGGGLVLTTAWNAFSVKVSVYYQFRGKKV